ncbi:MAG: sodium-translocating pyrophosphatase [Fibrobacterota bacterium]
MDSVFYIVPGSAILALLFAYIKSAWVNKQDAGTDKMKEIGNAVREGAMAFLSREYKVLAIFVVAVSVLLAIGYEGSVKLTALSFIVGAVCSGLAGFFGMRVATAANSRTTNGAREGLSKALNVAFAGGTVMGMCVVGLGILGLSVLFIIYMRNFAPGGDINQVRDIVLPILSGFSLGASSIALFARVGGGIYTKAADVGADLAGKVQAGIPEDDPRNPATIADNVGDNVGDVAGMGADLFESYVGSIVGAMVLGATAVGLSKPLSLVMLPLYLAGVGILVSIVGTFFVKTKEGGNPQTALNIGTFGSGFIMLILSYPIIMKVVGGEFILSGKTYTPLGIFLSTVAGLVAGIAIGMITEYYTAESKKPAQEVAAQSETGPATNIIAGLGLGMRSTAAPVLFIVAAILIAYHFSGLYGIAIAAVGMLATTGIQLAVDAYGPIADNAGGLAEMAELPPEVRERTDKLDAVGNTTAAIGKGFAIGSAALTALALFAAYRATIENISGTPLLIDITEPKVMAGLFLGAIMVFLFSSMAMGAVGRAAFEMIKEVVRQFKEIDGLMEGTAKAEYAKCVDISTAAAIREMVVPGLLAIIVPVVVGFAGGAEMLGGLLAGVTTTGVLMAIFMANAGGAWDNAKKYIEGGHLGGKGSETHKAAVVGDTVGDPFKDTAGPSLNILIKLMSVVALIIAPILGKVLYG